jgi:carbamoyl-phosphate synthase large subunit
MQVENKKNILVTGVGGPAGINAAKLLKEFEKDFFVFGCDINKYSAGQFFVNKFEICERVTDEEKYLKWMKEYIIKNNIDILLPTVAEELVLMEKLKKILDVERKEINIIVSKHFALELCDQKDKLYNWMDKNFPNYMGKWQKIAANKTIGFESENYFIKPVKGRGSRGCRLVSKNELDFIKTNLSEEIVAMEVLPGREWTVDAYVNTDGSFAYIVPRLRLGLSGGISSVGKTDRNETVIKQTREVLEKLGCRGPVFIQWKEDVNNLPKMVEVNPRMSGGLTITALSGANPIKCLKSEILDNVNCTNVKWKEVVVTRYFEEKIVN